MLRVHDQERYKLWYWNRQNELFSSDDYHFWTSDPTRKLFRNPTWRTALLGGDPYNFLPGTSTISGSDGEPSPDHFDLHRQRTFDRFWSPWEQVLRARDEYSLLFSAYKPDSESYFLAGQPCAADCDLNWTLIESIPGVLPEVDIFHRCCVFGATKDWALYCCEACSVLGGTPEFMDRFGEAAGGWSVLKSHFLAFLNDENDFICNLPYKDAVERTCERPIMAWS